MTDTDVRPHRPAAAAGDRPVTFRPDIEGLRAVAVVLVVASHAGIERLAGGYVGVDVFFVISGFLITTLLVTEAGRTGTVSLRGFYARRLTRLLPASALVVATTVVTGWFVIGPARWAGLVGDALSSVGYAVNWRLAAQGTDYLRADVPPSPLQHLWSLAVEEQFYVVWPLLVLLVWRWRARRGDQRRTLRLALTAILVTSLAASVLLTPASAPYAYFGAHTRAWELATGALLALSVRRVGRLDPRLRAAAAWAGLAAVLLAAVRFDDRTAFPGYAALLPVLGTAAAIAGGVGSPAGGPGRLLGSAPFRTVGALSYGWYLWHWPVLLLGPAVLGLLPGLKVKLLLAAGSLVLAWLSYRLLENPVRHHPWVRARPRRGLGLGLALSGTVAAVALVGTTVVPTLPTGPAAPDLAAALRTAGDPQAELTAMLTAAVGTRRLPANLTPGLSDLAGDKPRVYADGCQIRYLQTRHDKPCVYGDPAGARTVFLVGDSHAAQWFEAIDELARAHHVRLVSMTKHGCQIPSVTVFHDKLKRVYTECPLWREWVFDKIVRERPYAVLMASNDSDQGGIVGSDGKIVPERGSADDAQWVDGWRRSFAALRASGARLVLLQDTPWPAADVPACVAEHARRITSCTSPVSRAVANRQRRPLIAQAARDADVTVVDPQPWLCAARRCPVVVSDVLVYEDSSHISSAYARALEPLLDPLLPWGPPQD